MLFSRISAFFSRFFAFLGRRPLISFIVLLAILFGVIFLANKLRAPKEEGATQAPAERSVALFTVGTDAPLIPVQGEVKASGVIDVIAVRSGIVKQILVTPGQRVVSGQTLFELTDDYGTNGGALKREIAEKNLELAENTYALNKKLLELQARLARDKATSDRESSLAKTNLQIEKQSLSSSLTISELNASLAVAENAALRPRALATGNITSLSVSLGDFVNAGTVLATLGTGNETALLEVKLPASIALLFDPNGQSLLSLGERVFPLKPLFFSSREDSTGLVTLQFAVPKELEKELTDHSFVSIEVALEAGAPGTTLVPLDALFQDKEGSSILVLSENNTATLQSVVLRKIIGNFAELEVLAPGTKIVTDRLTVPGERVTPLSR